jgi:hypothetical protein
MTNPRMLMMDEPSIGLAPIVVKRIAQEIRRLNRQAGIGVIMVEQNIDFAFDVADREAILATGRVVHIGPMSTLHDHALLAHYLRMPDLDGETLVEIERIRRVIAQYGQLLDDLRFEEWGALFTEDAEFCSIPCQHLATGHGIAKPAKRRRGTGPGGRWGLRGAWARVKVAVGLMSDLPIRDLRR